MIRVLGSVELDVGAGPVLLRRRQVRLLLGVLACEANRPVPMSRLVEMLWDGEAPPTSPRAAVQGLASKLRRSLGTEVRLVGRGSAYELCVAPDAVDVERFRTLLARARDAGPDRRPELLRAALRLWRGPALVDTVDDGQRDRWFAGLEELRLTAWEDLFDAELARGEHRVILDDLVDLTGQQPHRERLLGLLMTALHRAGRRPEALEAYARRRRELRDEHGLEPGDCLRRLHAEILRAGDDDADDGVRDDDADDVLPPPAQLPPDLGDFTGRAEQVTTMLDVLGRGDDGAVRVVGLAGMGGVGKSTLAVHVAHRLRDRYPDGQLYLDLKGTAEEPAAPVDILGTLLRSFGVTGPALPDGVDERAALFRSVLARRRVLLVLDNAAGEAQVRPLLPGTPGAAVLVTGRRRLAGLSGAALLDLDVLTDEQGVELLGRIAGPSRVKAEPAAAREIVRLCGGVPLAVRIAGARLAGRPQWTPGHLAELLRDERHRLTTLTVGDLGVRSSLALSYVRLPAAARRALRLLGLLDAPDIAAWVVAALLDVPVPEAQVHIEALVDAWFLTIVGPDATGALRYRMHDLVRSYAWDQAHAEEPAAEREAAVRRAFGGWLWLAERAAVRVPGPCHAPLPGATDRRPVPFCPRDTDEAMRWFDAEHAALVGAVHQACRQGMDESAWELAAALEKYLDVRGLYDDWRHTHAEALRLCRDTGNRRGEAVLLRGLLEVRTWASDEAGTAMVTLYPEAESLLALFTELGEPSGMADALSFCAWSLIAQGRVAEAVAAADESLRLAEKSGHLAGQARAHNLAAVAQRDTDPMQFFDRLHTSLGLTERVGNPRLTATVLQFIGAGHSEFGDADIADEYLTRSLIISRAHRDRYLETFSLLYLAKLFARLSDPRAGATAEAALRLARENHFRHHLADTLSLLGRIHLDQGDPVAAVRCLRESVEVWQTRGWPAFEAPARVLLGRACAATGDHAGARVAWQAAATMYAELGYPELAEEAAALCADAERAIARRSR
jgi:DNA-binding SARP family transcriptional activator/tetratricopeptide (TPR) repeat protein